LKTSILDAGVEKMEIMGKKEEQRENYLPKNRN
jgi:hypothetical protein